METKEKIEKEYRNNISTYENAIKAWRNVKRLGKKDGSDFVIISKNFSNANIKKEYPWQDYSSLTVHYCYGDGGYTYDNILIDDKDTVNDVFQKINDRIQMYETSVKKAKSKLSNVERVFTEVDNTVKQLMTFCKENGFSAYEVCDYIRDSCWRFE